MSANKFLTLSEFRNLHLKAVNEEISYSRMVEIINELAAKHYLETEIDIGSTIKDIVWHLIGPASGTMSKTYSEWNMDDIAKVLERNFVVTKIKTHESK
jgi:hypothetical protein